MTGFDPTWLALRAPADARARSARLIGRAAATLGAAPLVSDLGSGTGAAVRAFGPAFPPATRWHLFDADAGALDVAAGLPAVETRVVDLAQTPAPWTSSTDLVTATALFDLASGAWIAELSAALEAANMPLLACLSFDGWIEGAPAHPAEAAIRAAFNAHQRRSKGLGGRAAGPEATRLLAAALADRGYDVEVTGSPWLLNQPRDAALIEAVVNGVADAAREAGAVEAEAWRTARLERTDHLVIGHRDLFAAPRR
ncbi:MAG: class I SAM-dependent methyltransferase [Pseudomonadota bacterium]